MTEKPILFNGEMVRAILDGNKTQTRRVIKPQPTNMDNENRRLSVSSDCPYGQRGTRLWVRETWRIVSVNANLKTAQFYTVQFKDLHPLDYSPALQETLAEYAAKENPVMGSIGDAYGKWRPSIHMPKKCARLWLRVMDIRVERVQDITSSDCEAEGIRGSSHGSPVKGWPYEEYTNGDGLIYSDPLYAVAALWNSINTKRGYPWDSNPWVWVIEFEREK